MPKSDVSSVTKFFPTINEGFSTTVASPGVSSGGTDVPLASVSGLVDGSVFVGVVEPGLDAQQVFTGTVDTVNSKITGVVWTRGTNASHAIGTTVVDWDTGTALQMISAGLQVALNQDGSLKGALLASLYPVGSLYINATVSTNPGTLLEFGTWVAFGQGRVLVGVNTTGTFATAGATGGEETHLLTTAEMPSHTHTGTTTSDSHSHTISDWHQTTYPGGGILGGGGLYGNPPISSHSTSSDSHSHTFTTNSTGSGGSHNNLQPYVVVYMWKRTA